MIDLKKLSEDNIGEIVIYDDGLNRKEGQLIHWDSKFLFVLFGKSLLSVFPKRVRFKRTEVDNSKKSS